MSKTYVLAAKSTGSQDKLNSNLKVLCISEYKRVLFEKAVDYCIQKAQDHGQKLEEYLIQINNWFNNKSNLVLLWEENDQLQMRNVRWSELDFDGEPASKIIKRINNETLVKEQQRKLQKQKREELMKRGMKDNPLPDTFSTDLLTYHFINLRYYQGLIDSDCDEIEYMHGDDFAASTVLNGSQYDVQDEISNCDDSYALMVGTTYQVDNTLGNPENGKWGYCSFYSSCLYSLTKEGLNALEKQLKHITDAAKYTNAGRKIAQDSHSIAALSKWLEKAQKFNWPIQDHLDSCNLDKAMFPVVTYRKMPLEEALVSKYSNKVMAKKLFMLK